MTKSYIRMALGFCAAIVLAGCAEQIETEEGRPYDPLEGMNRDVYDFNMTLDSDVLRPVAVTYRDDVPGEARTGIHNALQNLVTPVVFANEVLQGDFSDAGTSAARFLINTTVGVGGFLDAGNKAGLEAQDTGFGHTLATYGVGHGPYLVLPVIGPSTPREAIGYGTDSFSDPLSFFIPTWGSFVKGGVQVVDERSHYIDQIDALHKGSVDEYAAVRSIYLQQLEASDRGDQAGGGTADIPDYSDPSNNP